MTLGTATVLHEKRPPWAFAGADLDLDFANGRGWVAPGRNALRDLLSVTRASVGYAEYESGVWLPSASGVARITDKGLLVEEARTNSIRNNSMQGAVAGTPGTLPTNWSVSGGTGLTRSIVGVGTENGIDYIDIRYSGTVASGVAINILSEAANQITAADAETWACSAFFALVGGSLSGLTGLVLAGATYTAGLAFSTTIASTSLVSGLTSSLTRFSAIGTISDVNAAFMRPIIQATYTGTPEIDFTLRIGWPQAEEGSFVTSPIRTTTAAATRAADVITTTDVNWFNASEGTLYSEATNPEHNPICVTWLIWDGTTAERMHIGSSGTKAQGFIASSSTTQLNSQPGAAFVGGEDYKIALAYKLNDGQVAVDGTASAVDTALTVPTGISEARIGLISPSNSVADGYIKRVAYLPTRLTDAQLQSLTT